MVCCSFFFKYYFYSFQELNVDNFITHEMKFEDINKAFDLLAKGKSIRCVMWMDK